MADANLFQLELVTPERNLLTGAASEVILRTGDGDLTILAGHTPLVGTVEPGVVRIVRPDTDVLRVAVHGGFVQVEQGVTEADEAVGPAAGGAADPASAAGSGTRVTLLVGVAELADEIDVDRARVALEAAEATVAELTGAGRGPAAGAGEGETTDPELVEAEAAAQRARTRLEAVDAGSTATAS